MATNVVDYTPVSRTAWGAIFGGTFVYLAIMATFGVLGSAIFVNARSEVGVAVWMTILGIIALYFAGRVSAKLANVHDRNTGMYHGLIAFGLSVFASILVLSLVFGSTVGGTARAGATLTRSDIVNVASRGGWGLFIALFLGMIGAAIGGSQAAPKEPKAEPREIRRVA
jgi:cellobiose-specific phosphotransferase system component IIC